DPVSGQSSGITVPTNPTPEQTLPAPAHVVLKDEGGTITLTWEDPGSGRVPFIVSGGREGNALTAIADVPAGQTAKTIYGLNVNFNYCFTVSAIWAADKVSVSARACTARTSTSATP